MPHYAIYIRRSYKRADAASVSDETQEQMARALLPPGATAEVITDTGGHQSGASTERDGYQELLAKLRAGRIDGIAVYDLSRLHRNAANMLALRAELERRQVALVVATMPATRFDGATGRFLFGQLALAAQLQRDLDSERMASQCRAIFEAGGHRGLDPFGYRTAPGSRPRTLEPFEAEAEVVQRIWQELASRSTDEIADGLNRDDVRHRVERPWTRDASRTSRGADASTWATRPTGEVSRSGPAATRPSSTRTPGAMGWLGCGDGSRASSSVRPSPDLPARWAAPLRACGKRLHGQAAKSRGKEWRYYRCRGCSAPAVVADEVEAELCKRISRAVLPADIIELARTSFGSAWHCRAMTGSSAGASSNGASASHSCSPGVT